LARMDSGQLSTLEDADGMAAGIVALSMPALDSGWAKWASGTCAPAQASDGQTANGLSCTREIKLLRTNDGGQHWQPVTLPRVTQASLEQNFSVTDKTAAALDSGSASALDADTQPYAGHGFDLCSIPSLSQMQA